ncbi:MAG: hypothetical protein GXY83_33095 [Rhodopirellula sp.]|nr:hypothetical protein [Rhodopirellula sp.]
MATTELFAAIATAEQIASNLDGGILGQVTRDEYASERCRLPLLAAWKESLRTAGPQAETTVKLHGLFAALGQAYRDPQPCHAAAIRGYCQYLRQHLGGTEAATGENSGATAANGDRTPDTKPDTRKISSPQSVELHRFVQKLKRDLRPGVRYIDVARDFANGDQKKAESLLRQANRYPHLWKPGKTGH